MSKTWLIDSPCTAQLPVNAMAQLLDAAHSPSPTDSMLSFLNALMPVDYMTLVAYQPDRKQVAVPELLHGHSYTPQTRDVTGECFAQYRRQYWRSDDATRIAQRMHHSAPSATLTAVQLRSECVPATNWYKNIYEREHLADRRSFLYTVQPQQVFAINLYRSNMHGTFQPAELDRLLSVGPLLRHIHAGILQRAVAASKYKNSAADHIDSVQAAIKNIADYLSNRELQVCARIACGISADGIAVDLDVSPSTVTTLRKRAYAKLADAGLYGGRALLMRMAQA